MISAGGAVTRAKVRLERARADHPLVAITVRVFRRFSEDDGGVYSSSLTYYTFFSIFPLLLFLASGLGYLTFLNEGLRRDILEAGFGAFPLLNSILKPKALLIFEEQRGTFALLGLLLALYAGSGAIVALSHALNRIHRITDERNFVGKRVSSLKLLAILMQKSPAVVRRETLEDAVWGDSPPDSDALRVHIHTLRSAVDPPGVPPLLRTIRGAGYQLAEPENDAA